MRVRPLPASPLKQCAICNKIKSKTEFYAQKKSKDGLQYKCKACQSQYLKDHYASDKKPYKESAKRNKNKLRDLIRDLKSKPCCDCGETYPYYVMDFDHRENKLFSIGNRGAARGSIILTAEIAKCDVVCANCHRIRTHSRRHKFLAVAQQDRAIAS